MERIRGEIPDLQINYNKNGRKEDKICMKIKIGTTCI